MKVKYILKTAALMVLLLMKNIQATACDACKKLQPKPLQGITHGGGPDSNWDYIIVVAMIVVTLYVLVATVKCMFRPAEKDTQHIKRIILNDQQ
jgi:hypothetical protein